MKYLNGTIGGDCTAKWPLSAISKQNDRSLANKGWDYYLYNPVCSLGCYQTRTEQIINPIVRVRRSKPIPPSFIAVRLYKLYWQCWTIGDTSSFFSYLKHPYWFCCWLNLSMPFLPVLVFVKNVSTFLWHMAKQI